MDYIDLDNYVKAHLKESRYLHSKRVEEMAVELSMRFGLDVEKAKIASIFHDAERYNFNESSAELLKENGFEVFSEEEENPMLLHGALSALLLKRLKSDISPDILIAIRHHTLGSKDMGDLGAVLYISDYAERGRTHLSDLDRLSILSKDTLEEMVECIIGQKREYYRESGIKEAKVTSELYDFLRDGGKFGK